MQRSDLDVVDAVDRLAGDLRLAVRSLDPLAHDARHHATSAVMPSGPPRRSAYSRCTGRCSRRPRALISSSLGSGFSSQQRRQRHQEPRRAESALHAAGLDEPTLEGRQRAVRCREAFDRLDLRIVDGERHHQARVDRLTVQQNRAGATFAFAAALLRPGEAEPVPQDLEERRMSAARRGRAVRRSRSFSAPRRSTSFLRPCRSLEAPPKRPLEQPSQDLPPVAGRPTHVVDRARLGLQHCRPLRRSLVRLRSGADECGSRRPGRGRLSARRSRRRPGRRRCLRLRPATRTARPASATSMAPRRPTLRYVSPVRGPGRSSEIARHAARSGAVPSAFGRGGSPRAAATARRPSSPS